ncbi:B3GNT1, Beta-1,3-N-acetylGucosamiNylTransferase 1, homolog [Caenorhabditis elegans]|uniref:B3GNT1, Beta-1,3-N-acetylGucosamiNylTransferase 1, homolog n=1 Tax=Caenorhabditis elegans TaxID=6239 RepID=O02230_CAEEL|nr:B3GNT1, Beta-1,3-N-acetylGucosamiNylTransferase 1, homolog [Caenorhabditis elegans]CAB05464.2 B3GNT1, Beta-1,3-N-acetylGucosamiNylTransferase 1, homolog [Caenorhabditis elegans]|eukprot:NP_493157.2 B3GNT1, Beta-1,3-N-acetylGucosamiNylTransferase 1, homolog [Caenorhabditis elegans]
MRIFPSKLKIFPLLLALLVFIFWLFSDSKQSDFLEEILVIQRNVTTVMHDEQFCVGYNFLEAEDTFREDGLEPVTLAIHGTPEVLQLLGNKPLNWDGPISFGLFVDFHSQKALNYISMLHKCDAAFKRQMTVHFAFRISPSQSECPMIQVLGYQDCATFLQKSKQLLEEIEDSFQIYPINLMRNIARRGAKSDLHLIIDTDMMMSTNFAKMVKPIANRMIDGKNKQVLVVRRFETNENELPMSFGDLEEGIENHKTFQFHHKFFFVGHQIPNLMEWFERSHASNDVVAWEIPYTGNDWEVQIILHRNDPYNVEYFPSRVKDMQSLIYKLCRANYTFNLLSHVFNVHKGIKEDDTMYSKVVTAHTKRQGRLRTLSRYVTEIDRKYPDTMKRCGQFLL